MRKTAFFRIHDTRVFCKQLLHWAADFSSCTCFHHHPFHSPFHERNMLAAAGVFLPAVSQSPVFESLRQFAQAHREWIFGFLSYELKKETEPQVFNKADLRFDGPGFPDGFFYVPRHVIEVNQEQAVIHTVDDPETVFRSIEATVLPEKKTPADRVLQTRFTRQEYHQVVDEVRRHIARGDLYEVTICQEFFTENCTVDPLQVFHELIAISPAPHAVFLKHGNKYLLSASPERFMMKTGNLLRSQPMKGTLKRDPSVADEWARQSLLADPKERSENVMIVDLVRNDLSRCCLTGSVQVEELFGIYTFPQVHQMVSSITGLLDPAVHWVDALRAAFPMGSMTGAPKVMAMQLIDRYEKVKRGLYSGAVGYITPEQDFDFNVVIRSILYEASTSYLSFQVGSAITFASDATREYEECLSKAEGMLQALHATRT